MKSHRPIYRVSLEIKIRVPRRSMMKYIEFMFKKLSVPKNILFF